MQCANAPELKLLSVLKKKKKNNQHNEFKLGKHLSWYLKISSGILYLAPPSSVYFMTYQV